MIFSIILLLGKTGMLQISLTDAPVLLGFICGGSVIFWFSGASMQAVTTGAYRAVEYIKQNMDLSKKEADIEDSKTVVRICTEYAFFFQAEDGIRDKLVTGVQTCALPISIVAVMSSSSATRAGTPSANDVMPIFAAA